MPQDIKIIGTVTANGPSKVGKPTPLMSKILSLLRRRYKNLLFISTEIERFESTFWQVCELSRIQFDQYEKGKKYPDAAKKIVEDILPLINSMRKKIGSEENENDAKEFKMTLNLCIFKALLNIEYATKKRDPHQKISILPKGPYIPVSNEIAERAAIGAINSKELEKSNSGTIAHKHKEKQATATVSFRPISGTEVTDAVEYAANVFKDLDDLTTDVFLLHIAHAKESQSENGFSWMMSTTILDDRGTKQTTKQESGKIYQTGHRPADIDEVYRRVQQLETFWIKIKKVSTINGRNPKKPSIHEGRLLIVSERVRYEGSERVYAWKYKLLDGLRDLANDKRFCLISRKVLEYDPIRRSPEKRIGVYAAIHFRLNANKAINRTVKTIFEYCHLPYDEKNPQMSRDRFEIALNRLAEDGIISQWNYFIEDNITRDPKLPSRKWWDEYQSLTIRIEPPADLPEIKSQRRKAIS
jgi:hypothetical protein